MLSSALFHWVGMNIKYFKAYNKCKTLNKLCVHEEYGIYPFSLTYDDSLNLKKPEKQSNTF